MDPAIQAHCREIDRCNQRGGRMLSIRDLLDASTLTPELAAFCLAVIRNGGSFLVGAVPGGAGKTTVMGALLNFVPPDVRLVPADSVRRIQEGLRSGPRRCYICHEIGRGPYYAYLWGEPLRLYFQLPEAGHMLATNLHADTLEETHAQICLDNGVPQAQFHRMQLLLFLKVSGGWSPKRWIEEAWYSDGIHPHQQIYAQGEWAKDPTSWLSSAAWTTAQELLQRLVRSGARTIEEVRTFLVHDPSFQNFPSLHRSGEPNLTDSSS